MVLNGTEKQFEISWDSTSNSIQLTSDTPYTMVGGELESNTNAVSISTTATTSRLYLDGKEFSFTAYNINGNNYFKLRDMGEFFDFGVNGDSNLQTITLITTSGYTIN